MFKKMNIWPFFETPNREFAVREFARLQHVAPATASRYLQDLCKQDLLKRRKERNFILYAANEDSDAYKDAKKSENIKRIRASGLLNYLNAQFKQPLAIFLFGSYAKGENRADSDIDMLVIVHSKKEVDLLKYEGILKTSVQLFVHTPEEVDQMKRKNPNLINNILNGVRLCGFWEVF